MRILVVDDSKAMRMIVIRTLGQAGFSGHTFVEAANGVEALAKVTEHRPDLVLCDYNMPEMNGGELLQTLRSQGNAVPFGFITSESNIEVREMALESDAVFVIAKPFTVESLATELNLALAK